MAKETDPTALPASPDDPADEGAVAPDNLLEMLKESARRTEEAVTMGGAAASPFESFPVEATSANRLRSNPPEAIERHLIRLGYSPEQARAVVHGMSAGGLESLPVEVDLEIPGLERIIGRDMLMQVNYLEAGLVAARAVGRVVIREGRGGYGTGFLVSPRLLLTNNHVLPSVDVAKDSIVEFNYQRDLNGTLGPSLVFKPEPETFFVTSPVKELDFTLLAVAETSTGGHPLADFGHLPLVAVRDEVLAGQCVTIVQHPKGDPKQIALRENEVLRLPDSGERFLHYQTDTHPGSSGSPVFNDGWEVVALHHAGKPEADAKGNPRLVDGGTWQPGISLDRIKWIANEGIRVAAIVDFVRDQALGDAARALFEEALKPRKLLDAGRDLREITPTLTQTTQTSTATSATVDRQDVLPRRDTIMPLIAPATGADADKRAVSGATAVADGSVTVTIPLHVTVRLGGSTACVATSPAPSAEEKVEIQRL